MSWKVMGSNLSFGKVFFTHEIFDKGYSYILDQNCLFFQPIYNYTFSFGILEFLNKIKEPRVGQKIFIKMISNEFMVDEMTDRSKLSAKHR